MKETVWNVRIVKDWCGLNFSFDDAEEAEIFARTAAEAYQPDDAKFSVSILAVLAENVTAKEEES